MRRMLRENGLGIVMLGAFLILCVGLSFVAHRDYNDTRRDNGQPEIGYGAYLTSGHFIEALAENWESEFLQMGAYVALTAFLFQKGSPESKKLDEPESVDADPRDHRDDPDVPDAVRRGGWVLKLYEHSLSLAFFTMFAIAFVIHAYGGAIAYSEEQQRVGQPSVSTLAYMGTAHFWVESLENWQSEFLAVGAIVVLGIWLRERGSPESKPVHAPHGSTGKD